MAINAIAQSYPGAQHARRCLIAIARINRQAARSGADANLAAVALVLTPPLENPDLRPGFTLALGEFLAAALDGAVIDPKRWQPLAALEGGAV